jgi:hypothetical protein
MKITPKVLKELGFKENETDDRHETLELVYQDLFLVISKKDYVSVGHYEFFPLGKEDCRVFVSTVEDMFAAISKYSKEDAISDFIWKVKNLFKIL